MPQLTMRVLSVFSFGAFCASTGLGCIEGEVDLLVTVVNAHVKSADINGGKSDPFAKVTIGSHTHHTSTVEDNNSPVWDETLHYACANTSQPIHVTVWDRDPVKNSDLLMYSDLPGWTNYAQDSEIKLYNKNKAEAEYYVNIRISWTVKETCPSTCWGEYTCDYWDTNYGCVRVWFAGDFWCCPPSVMRPKLRFFFNTVLLFFPETPFV